MYLSIVFAASIIIILLMPNLDRKKKRAAALGLAALWLILVGFKYF